MLDQVRLPGYKKEHDQELRLGPPPGAFLYLNQFYSARALNGDGPFFMGSIMTLNRLALRLATVAVLTCGDDGAIYPTIASNRVYDSRLDPPTDNVEDGNYPSIAVYTDDDNGSQISTNDGGPPFKRTVDLIIEMSLGSFVRNEAGVAYTIPQTDPVLEAALDLFEGQVRNALFNPVTRWTALWRKIAKRTFDISSERYASAEGQDRLAVRTLTITVEMCDDTMGEVNVVDTLANPGNYQNYTGGISATDGSVSAGTPAISGLLLEVMTGIKTYGLNDLLAYVNEIEATINNLGLSPNAEGTTLGSVRLNADFIDPGITGTPDGTIEIEAGS